MDNAERMSRVNATAARARTDPAVLPDLWKLVERLVQSVCRRYCRPDGATRLYDMDDLCQSAYIAFTQAVDAYDPERGAFSTHLMFYIRSSCRREIGLHGKKDPLVKASSLDVPLLPDGESDASRADTLPDPDSDKAFDDVLEQENTRQLHAALDECMENLSGDHAGLLRERYYSGSTLDAMALNRGISKERARQKIERALEKMRNHENMRRLMPFWQRDIIDESLKYAGFGFFKNHWCSSVEWAAERILFRSEETRRRPDDIFVRSGSR